MAVTAAAVAIGLRSEASRATALDALEALAPPIPSAMALAAAPALVDAMATETERAAFDRCGLMLARVLDEAAPEPADVYGAAAGGERFVALLTPGLLVEAVQGALSAGQPLTSEDARSYACLWACQAPALVRGSTAPEAAAGRTVSEYMGIVSCLAHIPSASPFVASLSPLGRSVGVRSG